MAVIMRHPTGDLLLIAIAKALLASVRKSDIVARVGGDEFAILLDNIPQAELAAKADQLLKAVSKIAIGVKGAILSPSISAGFAIIEAGVKASELLMRADRSMYAAKKAKTGQLSDK
jgi:diguanylate cyclase (GGDEF)-like protein